jgi:putative N-acetyltransferase (TIGR04045 family)
MAGYYRVRNQVFVAEQGIYSVTDRDKYDAQAIPLVAIMDGTVVGTVRCYHLRNKLWYGGRLAVLPEYRVYNIGAALVRQAVETMRSHPEVERFLATVQIQNVRFFQRLGWKSIGHPILLKGVKHQLMEFPLREP